MQAAAQTRSWMIAEVVFGIPFLMGILAQLVMPELLPRDWLRPWGLPVGLALLAAGIAIAKSARREFRQAGQPTEPGQPTTRIVTTGMFAISRNPLYLAAVIFLVGVALAVALPWSLISVIPAMAACRHLLIAPEEKYLAARFTEYAGY